MPKVDTEISLEKLTEEGSEISKSYKKTLDARTNALKAFRRSCDEIDDLIEERKQCLVAEISEMDSEVEELKAQWTSAVSSKNNAKAAEIEEKIALLQARMTTKEKLINDIHGDYDASLLKAFKAADEAHMKNVFSLNAKVVNYQNRIDDLIRDLEALKNIANFKYTEREEKEVMNADRRMNHQTEYGDDEYPYQTGAVPAGEPKQLVCGVMTF